MTRIEKIRLAKEHVAAQLGDIIEKNYDNHGLALGTPGAFTALIEAYRACEIAEEGAKAEAARGKSEAYRKALDQL